MSSPSKIGAKKDQFVGNVKESVGSAVGNESLEAKGKAQNNSGVVQETAATVSSYVSGAADQVSGAVKGAYNSLTGDNTAEAGNKVMISKNLDSSVVTIKRKKALGLQMIKNKDSWKHVEVRSSIIPRTWSERNHWVKMFKVLATIMFTLMEQQEIEDLTTEFVGLKPMMVARGK